MIDLFDGAEWEEDDRRHKAQVLARMSLHHALEVDETVRGNQLAADALIMSAHQSDLGHILGETILVPGQAEIIQERIKSDILKAITEKTPEIAAQEVLETLQKLDVPGLPFSIGRNFSARWAVRDEEKNLDSLLHWEMIVQEARSIQAHETSSD